MVRLICSAFVAAALVVIPAAMSEHVSGQALAQATTAPAEKADKGKATTKAKSTKKKSREMTKGQKAFRERRKRCSAEYQEAKKSGKGTKGLSWPKFLSECNTRLKAEKS